ncbi:hypothetical protein PO909_003804 [Leuciscus waleckii]
MLKVLWITLAILWIIKNGTALTPLQPDVTKGALLTYSRDELLRLRSSILCNEKSADIPPEIRPRKRGSRGGVRARLRRRPFRPPLPSIILANVRSLRKKMDQLHAKCQGERLSRDACIIALTESWLDESISDSEINLDNFLTVRADRTRQSGKERGGGLCVFINKRCANIQAAAELIAENANSMLSKYPRAPVFYMGDYNNCSLDSVLPSFHQYVHCPTRKGNVLDLCYGNVLDAFTVRAHPPLGSSDHNVLVFLPGYRQELKRIKPQVHSAPQWSADATACLQNVKQDHSTISNPTTFANSLNTFYSRFDITDYSAVCNELLNALPSDLPTTPPFTEVDVRQELSRCKIGKAMGPDGIPARVLKLCAMELSPVLYSIMHESYSTARWPTLWKKSTIIPLPKKPRPSELNHYRPVALTPIASKCYEKLILRTILSTVNPQLDKHQFAYKARRGTEDAVVCLLHSLLQHLEVSGNSAAVLFVDLSSAITTYYKYSDDTAILALLNDHTSIAAYHDTISHFTHWCTDNFLHLNVEKTKELVFNAPSLSRISIHGNIIEQVEKFKYLGLTLDNKLTFDYHIKDIHKRSQQRLHILRKLSSLYIAPHLLLLLYTSIIQPILLYCSTSVYTMLSVTNKNKLNKITHIASKIIHSPTPNISELNDRAIARLARTIITDPEHPLNFHFTLLPSGRRYRTLTWSSFQKELCTICNFNP